MNISDIKAETQSGFARPNLFRVTFGNIAANKQPKFIINCFQAQIPGTNILTSDRDIGLRQVAYQRAYADMMIGFYCSGDMLELQIFQQWMDMIVNPRNNHMGYYNEYASTVRIEQLSRESYNPPSNFNLSIRARVKLGPVTLGLNTSNTSTPQNKVVGSWTLEEAFPKQIDPVQLDYGSNDIYSMVTVTMTYRKFKPDFGENTLPRKIELNDFNKNNPIGRTVRNKINPIFI